MITCLTDFEYSHLSHLSKSWLAISDIPSNISRIAAGPKAGMSSRSGHELSVVGGNHRAGLISRAIPQLGSSLWAWKNVSTS